MHGRKRATRAAVTEEEELKQKAKFAKLRALNKVALDCYKAKDYSKASFDLTSKLLSVNPDAQTLWNFRRLILKNKISELDDALNKTGKRKQTKSIIDEELELTAECIAKVNPKSYSAWYHRKWIVENFGRIENDSGVVSGHEIELSSELALCDKFLALDERNFHCWNYRSFIAKEKALDRTDEIKFTTSLIERNFSNYSAWHKRTQVVNTDDLQDIRSELDLVWNAIFTEPADQTCWIYHQWLVLRIVKKESIFFSDPFPPLSKEAKAIISEQIQMCKDLLELEEVSKWATFALLYLAKIVKFGEIETDLLEDPDLEIGSLCVILKEADPMHKHIYEHLESVFQLKIPRNS
mmetsp:Transcript_1227/g.1331  ORF Transcript_1227/g.1331 Transcript_1227/m.1331 type:complete len:352 (-) Transcript_1227:1090-2145(-)|eukprot:CAMPEP_0184010604 /NCGR_PEP_ID=MMETSP0954-20121128/3313_1 /TAXON_ID=627963 /ORGANISM="Aplanochytrium sp, Strain PBS07" /LENGTH=351 /DNA_ID=CAMNT_0026290227 /DNA_START=111 /DNA_END=1166 /DNA_ORIENTATION=-